jgi:hypothetical protein
LLALGGTFQAASVFVVLGHFNHAIAWLMPDDAFYYLKIAENISNGYGSVFSVGEPTNGYHPLWMAVLVALRSVLHPSRELFVLCTLLTAVAFNVLAAMLFARWLAAIGFAPTQRLFGVALYLFNPWIVPLTLTGIETPLFLACLFAFLVTLQPMIDGGGDRGNAPRFGIAAGALMLARTDSIFFTVPAFLLVWLTRPRAFKSLVASGVAASAVLSPWLIWNVLWFGTIQQSSSTAMSGLAHFGLPSIWRPGYWAAAARLLQNRLAWMLVGPLWRHHRHELLGFSGITLVEVACLLGGAAIVAHRAARQRLIVPIALWLPVLTLVVYYAGFRLFIQMWHFSTLPVLAIVILLNFVPPATKARAAILTALLLITACAYTLTNGYFYPQLVAIGSIDALEAYRLEAPSAFTICSTDAGLMAYFNPHKVINLDGVVNNRAAQYIDAGRLSDYIALVQCSEVLADRDRFRYYDRQLARPQ